MAKKTITTLNIIGIICLVLCAFFAIHNFQPSRTPNEVHSTPTEMQKKKTLQQPTPKFPFTQEDIASFLKKREVLAVLIFGAIVVIAYFIWKSKKTAKEGNFFSTSDGLAPPRPLNRENSWKFTNTDHVDHVIEKPLRVTKDWNKIGAQHYAYTPFKISGGTEPEYFESDTGYFTDSRFNFHWWTNPPKPAQPTNTQPRSFYFENGKRYYYVSDEHQQFPQTSTRRPKPKSYQKKRHEKRMDHTLKVLESMFKGKKWNGRDQVTLIDMENLKQLCHDKALPNNIQSSWDKFRISQKELIFNVKHIYHDYGPLRLLLFSAKPSRQNLLRFHILAKKFTNVSKITCTNIDYTGWNESQDSGVHPPIIITSSFIAAFIKRLDIINSMDTNPKLTDIILTTSAQDISLKVNVVPFNKLGWCVAQESKKIIFTKNPYKYFNSNVKPKIASMVEGEKKIRFTAADISIWEQLDTIKKDPIPSKPLDSWSKIKASKQELKFDMKYIDAYYALSKDKFFHPNFKNLLRFDKIIDMFPGTTKITCKRTDFTALNRNRTGHYASPIVSPFIDGVCEALAKVHPNSPLKTIIIKTQKCPISEECELYPMKLALLRWHIQKESDYQISLTKAPASQSQHNILVNIIQKGVVPKIHCLITGKEPTHSKHNLTTASVAAVFKTLILYPNDSSAIPQKATDIWNEFRNKQHKLKFDIHYMYQYYKKFIPILFEKTPQLANRLSLDKIIQLFPNVTVIKYKKVDCTAWDKNNNKGIYRGYSATLNVLNSLLEQLKSLQDSSLKKIIIQPKQTLQKEHWKPHISQFAALAWKLKKGKKNRLILTDTGVPSSQQAASANIFVSNENLSDQTDSTNMSVYSSAFSDGLSSTLFDDEDGLSSVV